MEIRTGSLPVRYHSHPSRCSRWRHIRGDTGYLAISCDSGFLSSYFSVCQVTMKNIRYNGTALPSDNMHHHGKKLFRMITIILTLFVRLLSVLFHIPVSTVPVFIRPCILRHPHQRPADRAARYRNHGNERHRRQSRYVDILCEDVETAMLKHFSNVADTCWHKTIITDTRCLLMNSTEFG